MGYPDPKYSDFTPCMRKSTEAATGWAVRIEEQVLLAMIRKPDRPRRLAKLQPELQKANVSMKAK